MKTWSKILLVAAFAVGAAPAEASDCVLRVTTWGGNYQSTYKKVVPKFEKENNCKVDFVVGASPDFMVRTRLGQTDVVTNTLTNSISGEKEGVWLDLDPAKIPNMANLYPKANHSKQTLFLNLGDFALAYNSKKILHEPKSWDELWDPKYKGRVLLYYFEAVGTVGLLLQQAEKHGGGIENIEPGLQRLVGLSKSGNLVGMADVESQMVSMFELGEAWIGQLTTGRLKDLWDKGAKHIKIARPPEGTFPQITSVNIAKSTKNPELAMKFVNFLLEPEVQEAFAMNNLYAPTVRNAVIPADFQYRDLLLLDEDAINRLYVIDQARVNELLPTWRAKFDRLMTR